MKLYLILLGLFALSLIQPPQAQAQGTVSGFFVKSNQRVTGASTIYSRDTLVNLDTIIVNLFYGEPKLWKIDCIIRCDSISGATAGSAILQYANDGIWASATTANATSSLTSDQVMWYPVSTVTLDGAGRTQYRLTGDLTARRARLFIVTPNATARRMMITHNTALKRFP